MDLPISLNSFYLNFLSIIVRMTTKTCEFHLQHLFLNMKRDCYFNMIKIYAESVTHD
jgi:hypothetical protein